MSPNWSCEGLYTTKNSPWHDWLGFGSICSPLHWENPITTKLLQNNYYKTKSSIKKWKKSHKQRYSLQQCESFFKRTKRLRNGQQHTKVFSNSGMTLGTCKPCLSVWSWSKLCDWKKKKNDWFWINCVLCLTNLGIETGIDYIGKRKKNHGVVTSCVI